MHKECEAESYFRHKFKLSACCISGSVDVHEEEIQYKKLQHASKIPISNIYRCAWLKKSDSVDSTRPRKTRTRKHHRHSHSSDFSYDPSSYALNFDDECRFDDHEFPSRFTPSYSNYLKGH